MKEVRICKRIANFIQSRAAITSLFVTYLLLIAYLGDEKGNYWETTKETISVFGVLLGWIGILWVDDARSTIRKYGDKNKILNIVNLINQVISTNQDLNSSLMYELLAELTAVAPELQKIENSNEENGDDQTPGQEAIKTSLKLEVIVGTRIYNNIVNAVTTKIQDNPEFKIQLTILKAQLENSLTEYKIGNIS